VFSAVKTLGMIKPTNQPTKVALEILQG